jgi:kynurenine formamidase
LIGNVMKKRNWSVVALLLSAVCMADACKKHNDSAPNGPLTTDMWGIVDLTHPLTADIPLWPGDPKVEITPWATYAKDSYVINRITIGEHSGTHLCAPNTFIPGGRSAEMLTAKELAAPATVIDIREIAARDPDYRLSIRDVAEWERAHRKKIPSGSVVILFTGWQDKWNDPEAFLGRDHKGGLHWPGFADDTVRFLIAERGIAGLGTDTHGADPGDNPSFNASRAMFGADGIILECLAGLDQLPAVGALLVIGAWPIKGGSGSPARILALVPRAH